MSHYAETADGISRYATNNAVTIPPMAHKHCTVPPMIYQHAYMVHRESEAEPAKAEWGVSLYIKASNIVWIISAR